MPQNGKGVWPTDLLLATRQHDIGNKIIPLFDDRSQAWSYMNSCNKSSNRLLKIEADERVPMVPAYPFIESSFDSNDPLRELLTIQGSAWMSMKATLKSALIELLQAQLSNIHITSLSMPQRA